MKFAVPADVEAHAQKLLGPFKSWYKFRTRSTFDEAHETHPQHLVFIEERYKQWKMAVPGGEGSCRISVGC